MLPDSIQLGPLKRRSLKSTYDRVDDLYTRPQTLNNAKSTLLDTWLPEVAFMVFSAICMAVIIAVLRVYDNHPLPSLPKGVTLNAVVSILATGAKSALLAAVASAIGQGKWTWFHSKPRPLAHAHILDEASRGPYGSLAMLFKKPAFSLSALGAVITVLSLGFDPFIQQVLSTSIRQIPQDSDLAVTSQATAFLQAESARFDQAVNNAIYSDKFDRTPGCPSGNCTWPTFRSFGWCSKCENVTNQVRSNCTYSYNASQLDQSQHYFGSCNLFLDKGYAADLSWEVAPSGDGSFGLQITTEVIWLVDDGNGTTNATFNNPTYIGVESPQAVLGHVFMDFNDPSHPEQGFHVVNATQCVLSYCVRDYDVAVESGGVSVSTSEPNYGKVYTEDEQNMACWTADPDFISKMDYSNVTTTLSFPQQEQTIDYVDLVDSAHFTFCSSRAITVVQGLALALGGWGLSIGSTISGSRQSAVAFSQPGIQEMDYFGATEDASNNVFVFLSTNGGLRSVMPRLADSLSSFTLDQPNTTQAITGSVFNPEVFVEVRWEWLSLPIALCVSGAVFLGLTAFASRAAGVGVWKGSSLAYLYHGLEDQSRSLESYDTASTMHAAAESTTVSLRFSDRSARVCLI